jgi:hypothetical protein
MTRRVIRREDPRSDRSRRCAGASRAPGRGAGRLMGARPPSLALRRQHSGDRRCACARWRRAAPYGQPTRPTALITTRLGAIRPADRSMGRPSGLRPARSSSRSGRGRWWSDCFSAEPMAQVLLLWPTFFLLDCIDSLAGVVPSARKHAGRWETIRDRKPERSAR